MIYGFMHICMINQWRKIVIEQLEKLKSSGLYDKIVRIYCSVLGVEDFDVNDDKLKVVYRNDDIRKAEFPILEYMYTFGKEGLYFYIHTKGVRGGECVQYDLWRKVMEYFIIERHVDCIEALQRSDITGVFWYKGCGNTPPHFAGNFWWTKSKYISKLPSINEADKSNRYNAEFWIGRGNPRVAELFKEGSNDRFSHPDEYTGIKITPTYYAVSGAQSRLL